MSKHYTAAVIDRSRSPAAWSEAVVLLVEDEAFLREYLQDVLSEAGFAVLATDSADEAFELLEERNDIRAVVADVEMPGRYNGLALAWHAATKVPAQPVVMISGRMVAGEDELPAGTHFLTKPFHPAAL